MHTTTEDDDNQTPSAKDNNRRPTAICLRHACPSCQTLSSRMDSARLAGTQLVLLINSKVVFKFQAKSSNNNHRSLRSSQRLQRTAHSSYHSSKVQASYISHCYCCKQQSAQFICGLSMCPSQSFHSFQCLQYQAYQINNCSAILEAWLMSE